MPILKPNFPVDATYDIELSKSNLTNHHQYDGAVETITYRMIRPFGLQMFVLQVSHYMSRANMGPKATDGRRSEVRRLYAAREALYKAAHEYDEAFAAVESLTQNRGVDMASHVDVLLCKQVPQGAVTIWFVDNDDPRARRYYGRFETIDGRHGVHLHRITKESVIKALSLATGIPEADLEFTH